MSNFTFSIEGNPKEQHGAIVCVGQDALGNKVRFLGQVQGKLPESKELTSLAAKILQSAVHNKSSTQPLTLEYTSVGPEKIPVVYLYRSELRKAPLVFFNHGTSGCGIEQLFMGLPLAEAGFFTVLPDAHNHGRRRIENWNEHYAPAHYKETFVRALVETCSDLSKLIDYLKDDPRVDTARTGITGVSQGGFMSFMAITMDKRITVAAPMIGSPDLESDFGSSLPFENYNAEVQELTRRHSPLRNYKNMPPTALLIQNGIEDRLVPIAGTRKLDALLRPLYSQTPERYRYIEYPQGHSDQGMREPAVAWLRKFLLV